MHCRPPTPFSGLWGQQTVANDLYKSRCAITYMFIVLLGSGVGTGQATAGSEHSRWIGCRCRCNALGAVYSDSASSCVAQLSPVTYHCCHQITLNITWRRSTTELSLTLALTVIIIYMPSQIYCAQIYCFRYCGEMICHCYCRSWR